MAQGFRRLFSSLRLGMADTSTTGEKIVSQTKEEIIKEAQRIEESCLYSSKGHFVAAKFWSGCHVSIGLPTAVLAAFAAASAFSDHKVAAGAISLLVTGLSAVSTFLNPNKRASAHLNAGNNYDALQNRTRIFRTIDCWGDSSDQVLTKRVKDFSEDKSKLNRESPQIPTWAYRLARLGIKRGQAEYQVDVKR